jgi:UDP-N-acetyl-D-mannosaminuronic acid dehydrogenase
MNDPLKNLDSVWKVEKIGVIGPGIVGMPMAGMLAHARIKIGTDSPARVTVVQRNSINSGWKVDSINLGKSVIGGIEPALDEVVSDSVKKGLLSASHDFNELANADVILVAVQTDKKGYGPDYGPMMGALDSLGKALREKPEGKIPVIVFESTLAPSSMLTVIREKFIEYGLEEGKDVLLGNSPNRVMPGRLVQRVAESDKLVAGLHPVTPKLIEKLYSNIVTRGKLYKTNSLTAEIVKTFENAYRDVRIAFSAEIVRFCDMHNIDFYKVRDLVNQKLAQQDNASSDPNTVPTGGILIPTIGVGGHCLPKDGILLWWRGIEKGMDTSYSIIIKSREINDESPDETIRLAEKKLGSLNFKKVALLGTAYRFNSEDTRNSPTLVTAKLLREKGCDVMLHDPFVKQDDQNLLKYDLSGYFTNDLDSAIRFAEYIFICTAHKKYLDQWKDILKKVPHLIGLIDGCNIYHSSLFAGSGIKYTGIGRGMGFPDDQFIKFVYDSFRIVETGVANELNNLIDFFNKEFVKEDFNKVIFKEVQRLAASCSTGCLIKDPGSIKTLPEYDGFVSRLADCGFRAYNSEK